jgi:mono/diheme cytochrome c family protein
VGPPANAPAIAANPIPNQPAEPPRHTPLEQKILERGETIYNQLCFACHAPNGRGTPYAGARPGVTMAPPLSGSRTVQGLEDDMLSVVLKGLSGPVNGKTYDAQMIPMESYDDGWIAAVTSYIRNNFGNHSGMVTALDVIRVREAIKAHTNVWTLEQLRATWPQPIADRRQWKLTASNNPGDLHNAIDGNPASRYDTHAPQTPGMWVQIELPEETEISGVDLDAGASGEDYPRGYKVQVATNESVWGAPEASGHSQAGRLQIMFPPVTGRFIRIIQTGSDPTHFWSIHELQVLKMLTPEELLQPPDLFPALDANVPGVPDPKRAPQSAEVQFSPPKRTPYTVE